MSTVERVPPNNIEAEEAVLGSLLIDPDAIFDVATFLRSDYFYREQNRWIYEAILDLNERREPVDLITLTDELRRREQLENLGGEAYLIGLINTVPTSINAQNYGHIVEGAAIRRRLISAASTIANLAYQEDEDINVVIDRSEQALFSVSEERTTQDLVSVKEIARNYLDHVEELHNRQDDIVGVPTGFNDLDRLLGGLNRSDLIIVAARPGMGKTSLSLSLAITAARRYDKRVAIFSLEMSGEQLVQRMIAAETRIDSQRLRRGKLHEHEWPIFYEAVGRISETRIFIDDTPGVTPIQLRTKCRRLYAEHGLDLILVDYLQLMQSERSNNNRVQEISEISRSMKNLARELDVPLVAAAQLSRAVEQRQDKRPQLSDLRDSGCLTGDTLVALGDGRHLPIRDLAGQAGFTVWSLHEESHSLKKARVSRAFSTGYQPVYELTTATGQQIKATANHPFWTQNGWRRLDQLQVGEAVAVASVTPMPDRVLAGVGAAEARTAVAPPADRSIQWGPVTHIKSLGSEEVFDLTVPGPHNFVANNFVVHNSIEQDADIVMFIYRDDYYNPDTSERPNIAEISVAKHRNGPTGIVDLYWHAKLATFRNLQRQEINL